MEPEKQRVSVGEQKNESYLTNKGFIPEKF